MFPHSLINDNLLIRYNIVSWKVFYKIMFHQVQIDQSVKKSDFECIMKLCNNF